MKQTTFFNFVLLYYSFKPLNKQKASFYVIWGLLIGALANDKHVSYIHGLNLSNLQQR